MKKPLTIFILSILLLQFALAETENFIQADRESEPRWDGYIIELKAEPLLKYRADSEATIKTMQEKYKNLPESQKNSILGKILSANIKIDLELLRQKVKSQTEQIALEQEQAKAFLESLGIQERTITEIKHTFNGIYAKISEEQARLLEQKPFVKAVHKNYEVQALLNESIPLIGATEAWNLTDNSGQKITGKGKKIAIIDTGVDYTHPDLGGCLGPNCKVIGGYDIINNDSDPMDDHCHGTHCAAIAAGNGTLKGVAPDAKILAYKVLNSYGFGTITGIIKGIELAVDPNQDGDYSDRADILSLSLGGYGNPDDPMSKAVDSAVEAGSVVVVAAGNSGPSTETVKSPGCARKAITVAATTKKDTVAYFSSRGPVKTSSGGILVKPDISAPGDYICAARYDKKSTKTCLDEEHISLSGTSMATPHVAGLAALVLQAHPDWNPSEVKAAIKNTAKNIGDTIFAQGWGRIDATKAVQSSKPPIAELDAIEGTPETYLIIKGTAIGDQFELYHSKKDSDLSSVDWTLACSEKATITKGIICKIDISSFPDGTYPIKLEVTKESQKSIDYSIIKKGGPDLLIEDIWISDNNKINYKIKNQGNTPITNTTFYNDLFTDGSTKYTTWDTMYEIPANTTTTRTMPGWTCTPGKTHQIKILADSLNYIKESNENNNSLEKTLTCPTTTTPTPTPTTEQIKCIFNNSNTTQTCYTIEQKFECTGTTSCTTTIQGTNGTKLTWKSTCGGYNYTTIDGTPKTITFECSTTKDFQLPLIANWNYFSTPVSDQSFTLSKLYQLCGITQVSYYDPNLNTYKYLYYSSTPSRVLEPGTGFSAYSSYKCTVSLNGAIWDFQPLNLEANKAYLIGAPYSEVTTEQIKGNCALENLKFKYYDYSSGSQQTIITSILYPGKSYWVTTTQNCTLYKQ
ncbi:MAG: S8 family serine peptidase [Candidatus Diapherotrites archaeon]